MAEKDRKDKNTNEKSRRSPALALLLVLLIAAVFFIMSDVPFIKSARDAVMEKLGYESIEPDAEPENGGGSENGSNSSFNGQLNASSLPEWDGNHYVQVNGNAPEFPDEVYERAGLVKDGDGWKVADKVSESVNIADYEADPAITEILSAYDKAARDLLQPRLSRLQIRHAQTVLKCDMEKIL